jgi:alcohol dehydrogenase class IV
VQPTPFDFEYEPGAIHYGRGRIADLGEILADCGLDRALVVCGSNTGANRDLMDPVVTGLGERHVATFDGTTPDKRVETAIAVADRADALDVDVLVPVGGGSSLDVATVATVLRTDGRDLAAVREEVRETGGISLPEDADALTPLVPVPTTLAGADLSILAGITVELDGEVVSTGIGGRELMPRDLLYDPALFETTPPSVLAGSAMNGFDKALDSLYAANGTPITDATAAHAVSALADGLTSLFGDGSGSDGGSEFDAGSDGDDQTAMDTAVAGIVLAQYGISRPQGTTLNVLHAFGHALRDTFGLQQGVAHAVIAPHALADLFASGVDPGPLVSAFGVDDGSEVVDRVREVRDALGLPTRLRDVAGDALSDDEDRRESKLTVAAEATAADSLASNAPPAYDLSETAARRVLDAAW